MWLIKHLHKIILCANWNWNDSRRITFLLNFCNQFERAVIYFFFLSSFQVALVVKNWPANADVESWVQFLGREDPWRRAWQPTPEFLPRESHGQKGLAGYNP